MKAAKRSLGFLIALLLVSPTVARAASGAIDTSFGYHGLAVADISGIDRATVSASQRDGKMLLAGLSYERPGSVKVSVVRFTAGGRLDPAFGRGGKVLLNLPEEPTSIGVQPSGRIILVLWDWRSKITLAGLTSRGRLDSRFGNGGYVNASGSGSESVKVPTATTIQRDGAIILVRGSGIYLSDGFSFFIVPTRSVLVRYKADGAVDSGFGVGGKGVIPNPTFANTLVLQRDGLIVLAGGAGLGEIDVTRLYSNGQPDPLFGNAGVAAIQSGAGDAGLSSLVVTPNGRIVGGGWACSGRCGKSGSLFFRLSPDGSADTAFGSHGVEIVSISPTSNETRAVAVLSSGAIVGLVSVQGDLWAAYAAIRLGANGVPDPSFGPRGIRYVTGRAGLLWDATGLLLQKDHAIVTGATDPKSGHYVGRNYDGSFGVDFGAVRLL